MPQNTTQVTGFGPYSCAPLAQREAIALDRFGGLSHTEIAGRLQIPTETVKGRIRLGLHKVRAELNPSNAPQSAPA